MLRPVPRLAAPLDRCAPTAEQKRLDRCFDRLLDSQRRSTVALGRRIRSASTDASTGSLTRSAARPLRSEESSRVESRQVVFRSAGFRCVRRFQLRGKEPPDRARLHLLPLFTPDVRISRIRRSRTRRRGHTQEAVSSIRRVVPACSVQGTGTSSFRWVGGRDVGCDV